MCRGIDPSSIPHGKTTKLAAGVQGNAVRCSRGPQVQQLGPDSHFMPAPSSHRHRHRHRR